MLEKFVCIIAAIFIFVVIPALGASTIKKVYTITIQPLQVFNTYLHWPVCITDTECVEIDLGCSYLIPEEYCRED